jgi:hypothetical protein
LKSLLTAEEFAVATNYFGVTPGGNFVDHSDPHPLPNQNVLSVANPDAAEGKEALLASAKQKIFNERSEEGPPTSR